MFEPLEMTGTPPLSSGYDAASLSTARRGAERSGSA
jgi:hypothetical protein